MLRTTTAISAAALLALAGMSVGQQQGGGTGAQSGGGAGGTGVRTGGGGAQTGTQTGAQAGQAGQTSQQQRIQAIQGTQVGRPDVRPGAQPGLTAEQQRIQAIQGTQVGRPTLQGRVQEQPGAVGPGGGPPGAIGAPTNDPRLPQTVRRQQFTQPTRGLEGGSDQLGTRSVGGTGVGAPAGLGGVGQQDPFARNQGLNLPPVTRGGQLTPEFLQSLTPEERVALQQQIGGVGRTGTGEVRMSQQRAERLAREQQMMEEQRQQQMMGQFDEFGDGPMGDAWGPNVRIDAIHALQRLEALENSLLDQNDMMLHRLGQVRQMPQDRQVQELTGLMQELLMQRGHTLEYIAQLRETLSQQSLAAGGPGGFQRNYGTGEPGSRGPQVRGMVEPRRYGWEIEQEWRAHQQQQQRRQDRDRELFTPRPRAEFGDPGTGGWYDDISDR
jgi:hypothetical protein